VRYGPAARSIPPAGNAPTEGVVAGTLTAGTPGLQNNAGRAPHLVDLRFAEAREVERRCDDIAATQDVLLDAMRSVLASGQWSWSEPLTAKHATIIEGWILRMEQCAQIQWTSRCPTDGTATSRTNCCHVPVCPMEQHAHAAEWVDRLRELMPTLRDGNVFRWRFFTLSFRKTGDIDLDTEKHLKLRRRFERWLNRKFSCQAFAGFVQLGEKTGTFAHLHCLAFCKRVQWQTLRRWLQAIDCTVRGCRHPSNDRCPECRAAKKGVCEHLDGDRQRCNGSWTADVRAADKWGGPSEVCRYAARPYLLDDPPRSGETPTARQLEYAERVIRFFLATYKRHRVYVSGALAQRHRLAAAIAVGNVCPKCHGPMKLFSRGYRERGRYRWERTVSRQV
jgi:hypothetical protein